MSNTNNVAGWFNEYYYSYKGLRTCDATFQSQRMSDILNQYVDCENESSPSIGRCSNLCGVMTEIAASGIIRLLTYPRFGLRISTGIEDSLGADLMMYEDHSKKPDFSIDAKMGRAVGPYYCKKLKVPVISLSFPGEKSEISEIISSLGTGDLVNPDFFYRQEGICGLHKSGILSCLQDTAGWILRDRMFVRSNGGLSCPRQFLNTILSFNFN